MKKTKIRELSGFSIWYASGNFYVDGCDYQFHSEHEAARHIEVQDAWKKAKDVRFMRIEYPYLQMWLARYLRLKAYPSSRVGWRYEWYSCGGVIHFNLKTEKEGKPLGVYRDDFPTKMGRPDEYFLFDQSVWDKAKEVFSQIGAGYDWQQSIDAPKPKENKA